MQSAPILLSSAKGLPILAPVRILSLTGAGGAPMPQLPIAVLAMAAGAGRGFGIEQHGQFQAIDPAPMQSGPGQTGAASPLTDRTLVR